MFEVREPTVDFSQQQYLQISAAAKPVGVTEGGSLILWVANLDAATKWVMNCRAQAFKAK